MFPALYHHHHNLQNEDLSFWVSLASQHPGLILELGCGTGRVLLPLWKAGHRVIGLDLDQEMLNYLLALAKTAQMHPPMVFQADCAHFNINALFSLVVMPCNTFSTLTSSTRRETLKTIKHHLAAGGIFAFSIPNPEFLKKLPEIGEAEVEEVFLHPVDGEPVQVSSSWKRSSDFFSLWWDYDHLLSNGRVQRTHIEIKHHLEPLDVYVEELNQNGMIVLQKFGDFSSRPFRKTSPNLIILAGNAK